MKLDIVSIQDGLDLGVAVSEAPRAGNILSVQLDSLDFAPTGFGTDVKYFFLSEHKFQPATFRAYCTEVLLQHQVNVVNVSQVVNTLFQTLGFNVGSSEEGGIVS